MLSCCGDSQILISFTALDWAHFLPIQLKLSCGADWGERVRGTAGTSAHPSISPLGTPDRAFGTGLSFGIHQTCSAAFSRRRSRPYPSLLPFPLLNLSHLLEDSKNKSFIQWKFGVSMKNECSSHSMDIMVKLLLT